MRRTLHLLLILLLLAPLSFAQQTGINPRGIVDSTEISGIDENELSQDLRDTVRKLSGQPFDQKTADDLVARIQTEKPEYVATARLLSADDPERVKVVFFLEKISDQADGNVNSRYVVERVEIQGYDEAKLRPGIRDDIKKLIGEKLDQDLADEILHRIEDALRPRRYVVKRIEKGSDRQHIVVVYDVKSVRWIPFVDQPPQHILYNSKQNFSAIVSANLIDKSDARFYFGLADDQDLLLERFAGFNFGLETRKVGTERLGFALRYARYHDRWQPSTVAADQNAIYRERFTFDPTITFAFDPRVRVTAGVSLSDLQMQYPAIHNLNANAIAGSFNFHNTWGRTDADTHALQGSYDFRAGNHNLDSEFIYNRHAVQTQYLYTHRQKEQLLVRFIAGEITGNAPLFEQFSLGDTRTLRGWNKFDVAPAGGNRMMHATLQYGFGGPSFHKKKIKTNNVDLNLDFNVDFGFHVFYDAGVVGDRGSPMKARHSVGFGFGESDGFLEFGFPIRSDHFSPIFMVGFRF